MTLDEAKQRVQAFIERATNETRPFSRFARQLVNTYLSDLDQSKQDPNFEYYFDEAAAEHVFKAFCQMQFSEGHWRGKPFELTEWQAFTLWNVYGWKVKSNNWRRYFKVYIKVPRKNGKTEFLSAIGIYGHKFDQYEKDAQVFWFATKKDQARIGFNKQKSMTSMLCTRSALYATKVRVLQNKITDLDGNGFVGYLGKDSKAEDGHNPFYGICDEYHAHPSNDMMNVVESGMGARRSPLLWIITTAGFLPDGVCATFEKTCKQILDGVLENPGIFPLIFDLDEGDDWEQEKNWHKANPSLGQSISIDYLRREHKKALTEGESARVNFLTKKLNVWVKQFKTWIRDADWMKGADDVFDEAELKGRVAMGGLDLASVSDTTSLIWLFPPVEDGEKIKVLLRCWVPEEEAERITRLKGYPYLNWNKQGFLNFTPGNVTDYNYIKEQIKQDAAKFEVHSIAFDRYNSSHLVTDLQNEGLMMEPFGQGFLSMSAPTKELEVLARRGEIAHNGNPVLRWMMSNVSIRRDPADNIKVDKENSNAKVDGVVALVMALGQFAKNKNSIYWQGEIFTII